MDAQEYQELRNADAWMDKGVLVFAWILIAWGLWILGVRGLQAVEAQRAAAWPTTPGVVTASEVILDGGGAAKRPRQSLQLAYTYAVEGADFEGYQLRPLTLRKIFVAAVAERRLAPYPVGTEVTVFYNPTDPAIAVLEPGVGPSADVIIIPSLSALLLIFWGAAILCGSTPREFPELLILIMVAVTVIWWTIVPLRANGWF